MPSQSAQSSIPIPEEELFSLYEKLIAIQQDVKEMFLHYTNK